jgi:hypothetical protein
MTLADFTALESPNGDLILESTSGDTTAIIKGFYSNPSANAWLLTDSNGDGVALAQWAATAQQGSGGGGPEAVDPAAIYTQEMNALRQEYADTIVGTLQGLGARNETIEDPDQPGFASQYTFEGVTTQNVTVQGGSLSGISSEADTRTVTTVSGGTREETISVPVYGEVPEGGVAIYVASTQNTSGFENVSLDDSFTPQYTTNGAVSGWDYLVPPHDVLEQTGTRTETITVPVVNSYVDETKGFTDYNIAGDGGNDEIVSAPPTTSSFGYSTTSPFVGTVDTGNGNVFVGLGLNWYDGIPDDESYGWSNQGQGTLPLGAFVQAGNGNDVIYGTYGADTIAAGLGSDTITASWGSTIYVPMLDGSTDYIDIDRAPEYGSGPYPNTTLVLPEGVTPEDLEYNILPDPTGSLQDGGSDSRILQITYGDSSVYMLYDSGAPSWYLQNEAPDDNDGINAFQFSDGTVLTRTQVIAMATANAAAEGGGTYDPVVTPLVRIIAESPIAASNLFSGSDTSGNIQMYQVSNTADSGAYFTLNGTNYVPGATVDVTAAQLSQLQYNPGASAADTLQVEAFDGVNWSAPMKMPLVVVADGGGGQEFQATGPDQAVVGSLTGPDVLIGGYAGDSLIGASGNDTFEYLPGSGAETLSDIGTGPLNDTLAFGAGITPDSITASLTDSSDLVLTIGSSGDSIDLQGIDLNDPLGSIPVQQFQFADGENPGLVQLLSQAGTASYGSINNSDGGHTWWALGPTGYTVAGSQEVYGAYGYNSSGQLTGSYIIDANGQTVVTTDSQTSDGYSFREVITPAGGGAPTIVVGGYDDADDTYTSNTTNPDGSTDDISTIYNSDGSSTQTEVETPASGSPVQTEVSDYGTDGTLLNQNVYQLSTGGAYNDNWSEFQSSTSGNYWWNASTSEYSAAWTNSDGSTFTDEYQYAAGGSPGSSGVSFTETYTDSSGDSGTRQYDAATGVTSVTWYSSATGTLTGTTTDSGFIGLQNDGELTNTQPDLSFFNPTTSPAFQTFLSAH